MRKEIHRWITLLEYYQFETSRLKNQLADALTGSLTEEDLQMAEHHQTELLRIDQMMHQLKAELRSDARMLVDADLPDWQSRGGEPGAGSLLTGELTAARKLESFHKHVHLVSDDFKQVKESFNEYLATIRRPQP